jgi:multicomponent Na+:H+ antiporter subunit C
MAYRSWQLSGHDDVQDDVEDAAIRRLAEADEASESFDLSRTHHSEEEDPDDLSDLEPVPAREHRR